jgi:hypothetical protein
MKWFRQWREWVQLRRDLEEHKIVCRVLEETNIGSVGPEKTEYWARAIISMIRTHDERTRRWL